MDNYILLISLSAVLMVLMVLPAYDLDDWESSYTSFRNDIPSLNPSSVTKGTIGSSYGVGIVFYVLKRGDPGCQSTTWLDCCHS